MAVLTIRLPDDKHNRLKALAKRRKISMNKLFEALSTQSLFEYYPIRSLWQPTERAMHFLDCQREITRQEPV